MKRTFLGIWIMAACFVLMHNGPGVMAASVSSETIGFVAAIRGDVTAVSKSGVARKLSIKDSVFLEESIKTGKRGKIQLMFNDNTIISLGRNSEMNLAAYEWNPAENAGKMKTKVKEGVFRVMGGAITKAAPENFTTETPTATIGIRGSMYAGKSSLTSLSVVFQGGRGIEIMNAAGSVAITKPGFGTFVELNKAPLPPMKFTAKALAELSTELKQGPDESADEESAGESPAEESTGEQGEEGAPEDEAMGPAGEEEGREGETLNQEESGPVGEEEAAPPAEEGSAGQPQEKATPAASEEVASIQPEGNTPPPEGGEQPPEQEPALAVSEPLGEPAAGAEPTGPEPVVGADSAESVTEPVAPGAEPVDSGPVFFNEPQPLIEEPPTVLGPTFVEEPPPIEEPFLVDDPNILVLQPPDDPNVLLLEQQPYDPNIFVLKPPELPPIEPNTCPPNCDITTTLPTDGVTGYFGGLLGQQSNTTEEFKGDMFMEVNWRNKKAVGVVFEQNPDLGGGGSPAFFFGTISGDKLTNVQIFGSDGGDPDDPNNNVSAMKGLGAGTFYGPNFEFLDISASGSDYDISVTTPKTEGDWHVSGIAGRETQDPVDLVAPTGEETWQGYVLGIAEDIDPVTPESPRIFSNESDTSFTLTVNKDEGTISGSMTANDVNESGVNINNLEIGGPNYGSAYVLDDAFGAIIGCSGGNCIGGSTGPKSVGNYITTGNPDEQVSEYVSWGFWEMAFEDPNDHTQRHVHIPGSMWIAGMRTVDIDSSYVSTTSFYGEYKGMSQGVHVGGTGQLNDLRNGRSELIVDFGNNSVTGSMMFKEIEYDPNTQAMTLNNDITLSIGGAATKSSAGFTAKVIGVTIQDLLPTIPPAPTTPGVEVTTSDVKGTFYGPTANSIGGNFNADMTAGDRYIGIFGGNKQ